MSASLPRRPRERPLLPVALALVACGCGAGQGAGRSDGGATGAILISLDTTRFDALGCNSKHPGLTPELDALAAESVCYEWARTVTPITLPSHASMLTGLYPPRHGVRDNAQRPLPESARTLAEIAGEAGVQTAAVVAAVVLDRTFGLAQGFEHYDQPERAVGISRHEALHRHADEVVARAIEWLEGRDPGRPFFLFVHLVDPHLPYRAKPQFMKRALGRPYLAEVAAMDDAIGQLLNALRERGLYERTFIALVADHGESLGEHGEMTHSNLCYDATIRVPMLLRYPSGFRAGERSEEIVSVVDLFPTLLDALSLPAPEGIDGISLYERTVPADRGVYFESYHGYINFGWSPLSGWADGQGKYLHSSEPELFRPERDPGELRDVITEAGDEVDRYVQAIDRVGRAPRLAREHAVAIDGTLLENMRALGYAAGGDAAREEPGPLAVEGLPSPASRVPEMEQMQRALFLAGTQQHEQALALLQPIVERTPENTMAVEYLAFSLVALGRYAEAIEGFTTVIERGRDRAHTHLNLAICYHALGDDERARAALERTLELDPENRAALLNLITLVEKQGDSAGLARYRTLLQGLDERSAAAANGG